MEEAVLAEFERISERGGVLGAMETGYQRGKNPGRIAPLRAHEARWQPASDRSQYFPEPKGKEALTIELARSTDEEKRSQISRLRISAAPQRQLRSCAGTDPSGRD